MRSKKYLYYLVFGIQLGDKNDENGFTNSMCYKHFILYLYISILKFPFKINIISHFFAILKIFFLQKRIKKIFPIPNLSYYCLANLHYHCCRILPTSAIFKNFLSLSEENFKKKSTRR